MAGFQDNTRKQNNLGSFLRDLSSFGMKYDDMVVRQSKSIGVAESTMDALNAIRPGSDDEDIYYTFAAYSLMDTNSKKNQAYFNKDYVKRRDELRRFAVQDEIEEILDTLTDECIVYDDSNYFIYPTLNNNFKDDIKEEIQKYFNRIYEYFSFSDGISAWNYFRKWLIDGFLAFEIIYNKTEDEIIGFKEIDPVTLSQGIDVKTKKKIWIQNKGEVNRERILYDSQVIYISYSSVNSPSRFSYTERLIRSFNLLRIMEHSRIIWAVMNASFKMKFIIPVGGKSKNRAKQSLAQLMSNYNEVVDFDFESGSLQTKGKPMMPFSKQFWLPSKDGEEPQVETLANEGPDLSDTETLKWFTDKLKLVSKIPFSRFDADSPSTYEMTSEGILREELKFSKFVNRLRSIFQEILIKPLYIQVILKNQHLKDDFDLKANLTVHFNKENVFEELKFMELSKKKVEYIQNLLELKDETAEGEEETYWDLDYLVRKYGGFTVEDLRGNARAKIIKKWVLAGYSRQDAEEIADGASPSKFKKLQDPTSTEELEEETKDEENEAASDEETTTDDITADI